MTKLWKMCIRVWKVKLVKSVDKKLFIFKESCRQEEVMNLQQSFTSA